MESGDGTLLFPRTGPTEGRETVFWGHGSGSAPVGTHRREVTSLQEAGATLVHARLCWLFRVWKKAPRQLEGQLPPSLGLVRSSLSL